LLIKSFSRDHRYILMAIQMTDSSSEFDSFSESSSGEEQDDIELMYGGHAVTILSSLEETIGKIDDFLSFERGFIHGDIVCSAADPSGQMGKVVNVDMLLDLENLQGEIITDVKSCEIQKIRSISVGDYVVCGPWLGKVDKIVDSVTILFDDGTKSEFTTMGPEKVIPLSPDLLEDSQYPYYPGQRVRVELSTVSKTARWLCGTWKGKRDEGTVCAVEAGLVYVDWVACATVNCERGSTPPILNDSKSLTLLSCFSHANWQLGDWCVLPTVDQNGVMDRIFIKQTEKVSNQRPSPNFQEIFVIVKIKAKLDVLWQDGSQSMGVDSNSLSPINILDAHDFWPGQFVVQKGTCDDPDSPSGQSWGVVRSVDAKERTVRVKWESLGVKQVRDLEGEQMEVTVSAYELVEHIDYSFCIGDVVFQVEKKVGDVAFGGEQNIVSNNGYLPSIGIVISFKDGKVEVKWTSGRTSKVAPYEIFRMDKYEGSSPTPVLHEENVEQVTQEVTEYDKQPLHPKGKVKDFSDCSSRSLPQAAIGIFNSIMGSLYGSLGSASLIHTSDLALEEGENLEKSEEDVPESCNLCTEGPANLPQRFDSKEEKAPLFSSDSKYIEPFKQFDMVSGCLDHHFVNGAGKGISLSQVKRSWLKKVQQEWSILEKNLPETIYVRIYEERMDLMRVALVGAPGTPYHDGLFFFDIFLPPEYPQEPPLVHYKSGGLRVNPNLYESGKVCLSLLNTWTGSGTEVWNPRSSTILQVLLSLQALVLNEKPYFNEAGYDKQMGRVEGEKNSVSYNENAFLVSCKSMLYLLRKPPKHFEAFVKEHFSRCSTDILSACKAYMEGAPVGCAFGYQNNEQENQHGNSMGFKIMLSKLFPKLVEAFSDKGIDCGQYVV